MWVFCFCFVFVIECFGCICYLPLVWTTSLCPRQSHEAAQRPREPHSTRTPSETITIQISSHPYHPRRPNHKSIHFNFYYSTSHLSQAVGLVRISLFRTILPIQVSFLVFVSGSDYQSSSLYLVLAVPLRSTYSSPFIVGFTQVFWRSRGWRVQSFESGDSGSGFAFHSRREIVDYLANASVWSGGAASLTRRRSLLPPLQPYFYFIHAIRCYGCWAGWGLFECATGWEGVFAEAKCRYRRFGACCEQYFVGRRWQGPWMGRLGGW